MRSSRPALQQTSAVLLAGMFSATNVVGQPSMGEQPRVVMTNPQEGGGPDGPSGWDLDWHTIDGGGAMDLAGGSYQLGATAAQPDAGGMTGGVFELKGGFWYGTQSAAACYANCDSSTGTPLLTANDFQCFVNSYAAASPYANCDGSTGTPALTANDFQCFVNAFAAGCS